ncbi:restriction endonuclease subunit S [Aggregatibacter aphrophilus]|uniref:restriction endonuclease subunit S n=1 Tax=Aggregatibacter aphrophilus TaxID=732 RepID=UPI000D649850|nr:restriction endonuclease subunit S [Aggregatibacter aphrophilus]
MKEDVLLEGWEKMTLGKLITIERGSSPRPIKSFLTTDDDGVNWVKIGDTSLESKYVTKTAEKITKEGAKKSKAVFAGDLILSNSMSLGRPYIMAIDGYIHDGWFVLRVPETASTDFLYYLLSSSDIQAQFTNLAVGGVVQNIRSELVKQAKFNLPPLPEQQYLSQKLTALLDEVAQTKQRLEAIPALLKQFRQSVLADAVSGRLTEEWREENGKIFEYISGTVADLGIIITGNTPSKKNPENYINGFFPMFKPTDLDSGYYLNNGSDFLTDIGKKLARFIPKHSTLVTCIGATIGKTAFSRIDGTCNQQINAIIPNSLFNNKWIYFLMISPEMQNLIIESSSSTTLPILNKSKFSALPIIYPPKEEQTQIVQKVETYFALADEIETQVNVALENVNLLTQSILAKAFSGELSATWRAKNG